MNIKLLAGLVIALPLFAVACSKKEAPAQEQTTEASTQVTAEQQAAIDAVDQPEPEAIHVEGEDHASHDATTEAAADSAATDSAEVPAAQEATTEKPAQ